MNKQFRPGPLESNRVLARAVLLTDPRFTDREDRKKWRLELKAEIESALASRCAKQWAALLN